jgi:hypothetical protein
MMVKRGINTTRAEKSGPNVKQGISMPANRRYRKTVTCSNCNAKLEKECPSEFECETSRSKCPRCGAPAG